MKVQKISYIEVNHFIYIHRFIKLIIVKSYLGDALYIGKMKKIIKVDIINYVMAQLLLKIIILNMNTILIKFRFY